MNQMIFSDVNMKSLHKNAKLTGYKAPVLRLDLLFRFLLIRYCFDINSNSFHI